MQSQAWELVADSSEVHPGIKAETAENLAVLHLVADHDRDAARFLLTARKVGCHRPTLCATCLPWQQTASQRLRHALLKCGASVFAPTLVGSMQGGCLCT